MKNIQSILIMTLLTSSLCACQPSERGHATIEKSKGTVQEHIGNATNDTELKTKGKKNKLKGDLRSTKEDVKDWIN
jgi:uncharacterized protein YjbJ (UPF0337 family)